MGRPNMDYNQNRVYFRSGISMEIYQSLRKANEISIVAVCNYGSVTAEIVQLHQAMILIVCASHVISTVTLEFGSPVAYFLMQ